MSSTKRILFLGREIMPYHIPVFEELVKIGYSVTVIHDTVKKLTPFSHPEINEVIFLPYENYDRKGLKELSLSIRPCIVYVSDWTKPKYNSTAIFLRKKLNLPVISGCDTQWTGGKQWFNVITSWFRQKRYFSHILIAGIRQYEYAKKLGFSNHSILWPLCAANTKNFLKNKIELSKFQHPRNFLFVGRFAKVKGLENLLKAWSNVRDKNGALLTLIGNGPLKEKLKYPRDVSIHDYMSQDRLLDFASKAACFILPSVFEPWALVIHEFAASGLPLIVTSECGATPHFVINNYNGIIVRPNSVQELTEAINKIITMQPEDLYKFSLRSRELSYSISPEMVAFAMTSVAK